MFYVYVIQSDMDQTLYYGFTHDLKKRILEHNTGSLSQYTKGKKPWKLIYYEAYINESDAREREKFIKSGRGREVLRKHLSKTLEQPSLIPEVAVRRFGGG